MKKSTLLSAAMVALFTAGISLSASAQASSTPAKGGLKARQGSAQPVPAVQSQEKIDHTVEKSNGNAPAENRQAAQPAQSQERKSIRHAKKVPAKSTQREAAPARKR